MQPWRDVAGLLDRREHAVQPNGLAQEAEEEAEEEESDDDQE